jgi:hypothetical protein
MNRRDALKTSVGLLAGITGHLQSASQTKAASEGERCPFFVAFDHGSYVTYFGKIFHTTGPCDQPHSFDGPKGLTIGCVASNPDCSARPAADVRMNSSHKKLQDEGMKKRPADNFVPKDTDIAKIIGDPRVIVFEAKTPCGTVEKIRAKIFLAEFSPPGSAKFSARFGFEIKAPAAAVPVIATADKVDSTGKHCLMVPVEESGGDVCFYRITLEERKCD